MLAYRRQRYFPVTKEPMYKVINSLKKIIRCRDWKIDYSRSEVPDFMPEEIGLEDYCEKYFPYDDSIENWSYNRGMNWMLTDPNAVIVVMPLDWDIEDNDYYRPMPHIIPSKDVYEFKDDELCVFLSPYVNKFQDGNGKWKDGKIVGIMTKDCYYEAVQTGTKECTMIEHPHMLNDLPCFIMGGENKSPDLTAPFYESFLQPMLPSLDQTAALNSDLEVSVISFLYPERWTVETQQCQSCAGTGYVPGPGGQVVCPNGCSPTGRGSAPRSPLRDTVINFKRGLDSEMANLFSIPPAGYIEKDTSIIELMMKKVADGLYSSLAAVNMEFLAKTPLVESGKAKEVDRDELNNFVYQVAQRLVEKVIEPIYFFVNEWRYMTVVPNEIDRRRMLPHVDVPENYDFLTSQGLEDELIKMSASQVSDDIKEFAEMDFVHKKYQEAPELRDKLIAAQMHNPLRGYAAADLLSLVDANIISKFDAVLATYLKSFITQLMEDPDSDFLSISYQDQQEILFKMTQDKIDAEKAEDDADKEEAAALQASADLEAQKNAITTDPIPQPAEVPVEIAQKKTGEKPRKQDRNDLTYS